MKWFRLQAACLIGLMMSQAIPAAPSPRNDGSQWPTLRGNAQRTAFYPRFPKGPLKLAWRNELWRELTGPRAEVIVGDGLAFMGTYAGNLHAWDANTGGQRWVFKTSGPIGDSAAFRDGVVVGGSMGGNRQRGSTKALSSWQNRASTLACWGNVG